MQGSTTTRMRCNCTKPHSAKARLHRCLPCDPCIEYQPLTRAGELGSRTRFRTCVLLSAFHNTCSQRLDERRLGERTARDEIGTLASAIQPIVDSPTIAARDRCRRPKRHPAEPDTAVLASSSPIGSNERLSHSPVQRQKQRLRLSPSSCLRHRIRACDACDGYRTRGFTSCREMR